MKYGELTLGQIEAVVNRLGGMEGVQKLLAGELVISNLALNWQEAYVLLELGEEHEAFLNTHPVEIHPGRWNIPVLKGVTCNKVVKALKEAGVEVYEYTDDLDKDVTENDRDPNRDGSYVVSVKAVVEADEEHKNKSANMLKEEGHQGITLLERLLLELAYFLTTKEYLDVKNWTLCTGSRYSHGGVPSVRWNPDFREVCVDWSRPGDRDGSLRPRSVSVFSTEAVEA